ncbi:MAG: PAS domain S-box protein [Candidatus Aminicenantales bacterium]
MEEKLQKSGLKYRNLFESSRDGIVFTDMEGNILDANQAYLDMFGYTMEEIRKLTYQQLTPTKWSEMETEIVKNQVTARGYSDEYEKEHIKKDGTIFPVVLEVKLIRNTRGEPAGMWKVVRNLTERKREEEELRKSEERFRHISSTISDISYSCVTDKDGIPAIDWMTGATEQITGYSIDEIKAMHCLSRLVVDEDLEHFKKHITGIAPGSSGTCEVRLRHKNGGIVWVTLFAECITAHGQPERTILYGGLIDITERKRAEEALRRQTERLRNLHATDIAILLAIESPEAIVQTVLHYLCGLLQCQRASVGIFNLEKKEVRVFAAEVNGETIVQTGKVLAEEAYGDLEILRQGKLEIIEDLSRVTLPSAVVQVLQAEGIRSSINIPLLSTKGLIGGLNVGWEDARAIAPEEREIAGEVADQIAIAIEHARLLQETKRYAVELEQRVRERTAQLESANKELEEFAYSVSHDLRAPLRAIDGYVRILVEEFEPLLDAEGKRVCSVINESARNMGKLIDDLLKFSSFSRAEMQPSLIEMKTLANSIFFELTTPESRERIDFRIGSLPGTTGDPALIRQVWINLISNAIKFSSGKERAIIEVNGEHRGKRNVYSVKDNGVGFDMQYAQKLFAPFQRLHSTREFEGTGVGLAIVQRIICRHRGRVWGEGEIDKGAVFYFTLQQEGE